MKKINKDNLIELMAKGFWVAYVGLLIATVYGTIYHFRTITVIKHQGNDILRILNENIGK